MRKFILKISYFLAAFITLNVIIGSFLPENKYWGNHEYELKLKEYQKQTYNTVFFGSSRILTGINPEYFDSIVNTKTPTKIKSFNLGTMGTWSNETFYLYESFLQDSVLSKDIDVAFMEFQNIMAIRFDKITTPKVTYYQSGKNLTFMLDFAREEVKSNAKRIPLGLSLAGLYSLATAVKSMNISKSKIFVNDVNDSIATFDTRGFMTLNRVAPNNIERTLSNYIRNIDENIGKTDTKPNRVFQEKLMDLIGKSDEKGIKLIFVLPPVRITPSMMAVFNNLPVRNRVEVCDPAKFPELYYPEHWADNTHLNIKGTKYLNSYLANELLQPMLLQDVIN